MHKKSIWIVLVFLQAAPGARGSSISYVDNGDGTRTLIYQPAPDELADSNIWSAEGERDSNGGDYEYCGAWTADSEKNHSFKRIDSI